MLRTTFITAKNLSEAWFRCCRSVLEVGYEYTIDKGSYEEWANEQKK